MKTTTQFLTEEVYLPGWMLITAQDYEGSRGVFGFSVKEPQVTRGPLSTYLTPRGVHICISQSSYALFEELVQQGRVSDLDIPTLRQYALQGRLKITELYQKFRREISLLQRIRGRMDLIKSRFGKMPIFKIDFVFENRAIEGNLVAVIAPHPAAQLNQDILRN